MRLFPDTATISLFWLILLTLRSYFQYYLDPVDTVIDRHNVNIENKPVYSYQDPNFPLIFHSWLMIDYIKSIILWYKNKIGNYGVGTRVITDLSVRETVLAQVLTPGSLWLNSFMQWFSISIAYYSHWSTFKRNKFELLWLVPMVEVYP